MYVGYVCPVCTERTLFDYISVNYYYYITIIHTYVCVYIYIYIYIIYYRNIVVFL